MNDDFETIDVATLKKAEAELTRRILKTQSEIRRVDLIAALCAFATIALALLLFGVVLDCWALPNGLSSQGRVYYAIFGVAFTLIFFIWRLIPVFLRRVNVLFAAKELEIAWEDKHNLTINWLQLCKLGTNSAKNVNTSSVRQDVLREVLLQAANKARAHTETNVDYSKLIRWGVAFAIVVALCSAYVVFSSKNPFIGARRIITPLAEVDRPQALRFKAITPGDVVAYQGEFLEIEAEIPGTDNSSDVEILYSTSDGRLVDVVVPMESLGTSKFHATFPEDPAGLVEDVSYRVVVGRGTRIESSSESYLVEVRPLPSFRVDKVTLTFPEYTGLAEQTFENQGEVRAVEGTQVSLTARCNATLERASFLPNGERPLAQRMKIDANNPHLASIDFKLDWVKKNETDNRSANIQPFSFYQLVSHDVDGQVNRDVQDYPVSIVADLPPTIRWESAPDELVKIPLNDVLHLKLAAEDPDFSLRSASLFFAFHNLNEESDELTNRTIPEPVELSFSSSRQQRISDSKGPTPYVGLNYISCEISPERLGFSVGDEVEYWAVAYDSKFPNPNSGVTERRIFAVIEPVANPNGINADSSEPAKKEEQESSSTNKESEGNGETQRAQSPSNGSEQMDDNQNDSPENQGESRSNQTNNQDASGGSSSEPSGEGEEESNNNGAKNSSDGGESNSGSDENDKSSDGSNQNFSPNQDSQRRNEETNGSSDPKSGNQNKTDQNDPNASSPSESQTDQQESPSSTSNNSKRSQNSQGVSPGEAFEKILDYMNETDPTSNEGSREENQTGQDTSTSEQSNGGSNTSNGENKAFDEYHNSKKNQSDEREVDPDFDSSHDIPQPNEKRELPTRTNSQKPDSDAPSYQAENPDSIDANASRKQGEIDPNTNDFLGQNPNEDLPVSNNANKNANIILDPMDQSQPVAAEAVDPNATEAKGNPNSDVSEAPYEVDQQQNNKSGRGNNSQTKIDKSQLPDGIDGEEGSSTDENQHSQNDTLKKQGDENNNQGKDQNSEQSASSGNSNKNAERQGGGGGTGTGEVESERQTLAPADSPKLQYAEQATNLVIGYLEDSLKDAVDRELLDKLGWTEEQLRDFLKRWQKMRDEAGNGDEQGLKNYLKALEETTLNSEDISPDENVLSPIEENKRNSKPFQNRPANEASRIKTPERLSERVRAFTQGVSQGVEKR